MKNFKRKWKSGMVENLQIGLQMCKRETSRDREDALKRGMALPELQSFFGHVKPETTMIYAKTCNENVKYNHQRCIV